ncbi:MAG: hypothetical protein RR959_08480 [Erysipelotrichaceae bacterium]
MNLGWYEIMDRIAMIQNSLNDNVCLHQEADVKLQSMLHTVQANLNKAYNYSATKFDESCEQTKGETE